MATQFHSSQYEYRVTWDPRDDIYVARVTELPRLAAHGGTPEEALRELRGVVDDVLEELAAGDEPIPEPLSVRQYSGKFALRMPPELHRQLAAEANRLDKSINAIIVEALQRTADQT